ncbi:hypothetical protein [Butyrivibrio sp.]|nr:hypothetical protein [Butyrivibrio sp.]
MSNRLSDIISKDLKKIGFKYLGKYPTVAKKRFLEKQVMYFGG